MATRAGYLLRCVSKSMDFILIFAAAEALPTAGWFAGLLYLLVGDGLFEGQSLGKKLTGLRVVGSEGQRCSMRDSMLRNAPFALGLLLWRIPYLGWLLLGLVLALEFVMMYGSSEGRRLGDEMARTLVIEEGAAATDADDDGAAETGGDEAGPDDMQPDGMKEDAAETGGPGDSESARQEIEEGEGEKRSA